MLERAALRMHQAQQHHGWAHSCTEAPVQHDPSTSSDWLSMLVVVVSILFQSDPRKTELFYIVLGCISLGIVRDVNYVMMRFTSPMCCTIFSCRCRHFVLFTAFHVWHHGCLLNSFVSLCEFQCCLATSCLWCHSLFVTSLSGRKWSH